MASSSAPFMFLALTLLSSFVALTAANFYQDFDITWGDGRGKMLNNGDLLSLSLDKAFWLRISSKNEFLFGKIDMQLSLFLKTLLAPSLPTIYPQKDPHGTR
ncbi:hypothetical protein SLA2020_441780 [Shorea laevis]